MNQSSGPVLVTAASALRTWRRGRTACGVVGLSGTPVVWRYLVELGLAGEGRRGRAPALLACSQVPSSLRGRRESHRRGEQPGQRHPPAQQRSWPGGDADATVCAGGVCGLGVPRGLPRGGWGSDLGPLGSDQGLQATTAAGLNLPRAGVLKLAGSVDSPDLDALLGTTWEEMLSGRAAGPAGPAQPHCRPRASGGQVAERLSAL